MNFGRRKFVQLGMGAGSPFTGIGCCTGCIKSRYQAPAEAQSFRASLQRHSWTSLRRRACGAPVIYGDAENQKVHRVSPRMRLRLH